LNTKHNDWNSTYISYRSDNIFIRHFILKRPPVLFHYTSTQASESILKNRELWFSKFDLSRNDSQEFRKGLDLCTTNLKHLVSENQNLSNVFDRFIVFLEIEVKEPELFFYMACFCRSNTNSHLLKNYSGRTSGSLLHFSFDERDFGGQIVSMDVCYSEKKIKKKNSRLIWGYYWFIQKNFDEWVGIGKYDEFCRDIFIYLLRDIFILSSSYKRNRFSLERETRIITWGTNLKEERKIIPLKHSLIIKL